MLELKHTKKVVGIKQSKIEIRDGKAKEVYIAADAEDHVRLPLIALCKDGNVPVVSVPKMSELGEACGIDIGAAVAVVLND